MHDQITYLSQTRRLFRVAFVGHSSEVAIRDRETLNAEIRQ